MSASYIPSASASPSRPASPVSVSSAPPSPTPSITISLPVWNATFPAWKSPLPSWKRPASTMSRNQKVLIGIQVFIVVYLLSLLAKFHYYGAISRDKLFSLEIPLGGSAGPGPNEDVPLIDIEQLKGNSEYPLNVFLVNTPNYHFEVFVPVIEAFKRIDNINVTLFSTEDGMNKWGLRNAIEIERDGLTLLDAGDTPVDEVGVNPDFIFLTTCPEDMRMLGKSLHVALAQGAHVMCIVHQAHLWDYRKVDQYANEIAFMRPWVERGQWHFAALSRHVHTYIRSNFPQYLETPQREYRPLLFHPVFNYSVPENLDFNSATPFAIIPGKFESERRNYDSIFTEYGKLKCDISLRLVGSGRVPKIADGLNHRIGFITNLNFFEFFHEMSKGVAIIPTLGNEHYLKSQASSTVATSIIAGTPLIASQEFLVAHSQIPIEAVWLQGEHETELQVLQRIGHLPSSAWQQKKDTVERLRWSLIHENVARTERMLNAIGSKYRPVDIASSSS
ncbi:hypothetical protein POJ06DRAFT_275376 [Lipomyces tetrasporus]|uniref:Uncharacterized protein n=1 Tax=Lipomyces tetrasporus TaxID=54092 RepID=A0AAD7QRZ0_9ASCO|nr:uncharacterized protein POJ06DRAFT_275376 [Lipomyces tetrasporus]KAJ8100260.1 hypothetical protein POJ06DRAFT_275376 [Lipomyces tetrasporus]